MIVLEELGLFEETMPPFMREKWVSPALISDWAEEKRGQGLKIATLNGSFDLLHAGHLHILYEASLVGDCLIVALNSDASIRRYKSKLRPIIPLKYRLEMMAALGFVDYVTCFDEDDPRELLGKIKPDIHVNGSEWGENCIESAVVKANGGRMHIVSLKEGLSTSKILEKIHETHSYSTL